MTTIDKICWVLTDDKAGTRHQCTGLATRLGWTAPLVLTSRPRWPWSALPARWWGAPLWSQKAEGAKLAPPWPDLLIVSGRGAVALGPAIRRASHGRTKLVAVQDPRLPLDRFDLVIAPRHDGLAGANVLAIDGALTGVTPERLEQARAEFSHLATLPSPRIGVLIGGGNRHFRFTATEADAIGQQLRTLAAHGASIMVTTSRRTDPAAQTALLAALDTHAAFVWDGHKSGPGNPYWGFLAWADHLLVTADSVSMLCEAISSGCPTEILPLPAKRLDGKFSRFHHDLQERGLCRLFEGRLTEFSPPPFDETGRAALAVQALFPKRVTPDRLVSEEALRYDGNHDA